MTLQVDINTDGFAKFADFFFEGIFADLYMQDRISESQNSVRNSSISVEKMCSKLEQLLREEQQKVGRTKYELERLIISEV